MNPHDYVSPAIFDWVVMPLFVCLGTFALDFVWAMYSRKVADRAPYPAAGLSVAIFLIGGVVTINYITNPVLLIPASVGGFVGTFLSVNREKRKEARK